MPGRVDELEHEVGRAALRAQPPLRLDGEDALDDAVRGEVGDHHAESKRPGSLRLVPTISPFRALRYDEAVAGPLDELVAPPYDVIDDDALLRALARERPTTSST